MWAFFTRRLQLCIGEAEGKKKGRVSRVADENMDLGADAPGDDDVSNNKRRSGFFWFVMRAPLSVFACLASGSPPHPSPSSSSSSFEEEEECGNLEQRIWFSVKPSIAERNYLLVRSSMRYAISM